MHLLSSLTCLYVCSYAYVIFCYPSEFLFLVPYSSNSCLNWEDLKALVVPVCAVGWMEVGKELHVPNGILYSIDSAGSTNILWCCERMFSNWLKLDRPKSWDGVLEAISSPEVTVALESQWIPSELLFIDSINELVCDLACKIQVKSIKLRYATSSNNWQLPKPQHFTSVAIIQHNEGKISIEIIEVLAEIHLSGNIKNHKNLSELFVDNPKHILIEGAPGIGKTTLAEEIVFQWSHGNILLHKKFLLLVYLRDLINQDIASFKELIKYCIKNVTQLEDTKINILGDYIIKTQGEDVVLILDGYDELSGKNIKNNDFFINKIIDRDFRDFMNGMVIITSRPNVSARLHMMVDRRVEILGFTEANRMEYIEQALKGNDKDIKMLQTYLAKNPAINAYCYIPLNMTILLHLFSELGPDAELPTTQTEINKLFICHTISRYIKKNCLESDTQQTEFTGTDFSKIPTPHDQVFLEMSKYSLFALQKEKIVFEKNEIESLCPNLTLNFKTWNGLGLLKAVQFYSIKDNDMKVSFNFLHLSIQEILAAYHVTLLSDDDQVKLLKKTFWDSRYFNMWIMYVGLTKGQSFAFKHFLSGNSFHWSTWTSIRITGGVKISQNIIEDKIKCLRLFHCFAEAEDKEMCQYVGQILRDGNIDLSEQTLRPVHVNTLSVFLTQTNVQEWKLLNFSKCYLEDEGFNRLYASISGNNRSIINITS